MYLRSCVMLSQSWRHFQPLESQVGQYDKPLKVKFNCDMIKGNEPDVASINLLVHMHKRVGLRLKLYLF